MPRKAREFEIGAIYHIVNRGVEKRRIFETNQDYSRFILALEFFNAKNPFKLWDLFERTASNPALLKKRLEGQRDTPHSPIVDFLAFALMPNHFHLIVKEIVEGGVSLFMQKIGGYSTYFNKQHDRVGPLFQSRYKAVRVQDDIQLANVFVYVHTNPVELVEAGWKEFKVKDPNKALTYLENYKWSSYRDYIGSATFPTVIQQDFFHSFYGREQACRNAVEDWVRFKAKKTKLGLEIIE